ncbi:VOC family protein [Neptunomonas japonica]|uniref:VOC family protein n=1 Tax=Neptunomonas japonica TaxID=417574 RepID=UPI0004240292|nr:VOC family protein [Neptunomonas japonica]
MKEITRINHVGLRVASLEVARGFYEKLGFDFIVGPVGPEPVAVMEHPSGININFILNASAGKKQNVLMDVPDKHTGFTHIALEVTDLAAAQAYLESISYTITEGPIVTPQGASFIFIRDPDDNVIEFHQPAS